MAPDPAGPAVQTSASFGLATRDFTGDDGSITLPDLILTADKLLYAAKRNGRNRVEAIEMK